MRNIFKKLILHKYTPLEMVSAMVAGALIAQHRFPLAIIVIVLGGLLSAFLESVSERHW